MTLFSARDGITSVLARAGGAVTRFASLARARFNTFTATLRQNSAAFNTLADKIKAVSIGNIISQATLAAFNVLRRNIGGAIAYASDLIETQNVVETTFKESAAAIEEFARSAQKNFGISELQAKKAASGIGAIFSGFGIGGDRLVEMSKGVAALSGDLASFYNLDAADAFNTLRSGLSGEAEPLKKLGVLMNETSLNAYLLAQGVKGTVKEFDQASQAVIRYNFILEKTRLAQGDYAKPIDSYAVSTRNLTGAVQELWGRLAAALLPTLIQVIDKITLVVRAAALWAEANQDVIAQKFEDLVAKLFSVARTVVAVAKAAWNLRGVLITMFLVFKGGAFAISVLNAFNIAMGGNAVTARSLIAALARIGPAAMLAVGAIVAVGAAIAGVLHLAKQFGEEEDKKREARLRANGATAWRNNKTGEITTDLETAKSWDAQIDSSRDQKESMYAVYDPDTDTYRAPPERVSAVDDSYGARAGLTTEERRDFYTRYAEAKNKKELSALEIAMREILGALPASTQALMKGLEAQQAERHDYELQSLAELTKIADNTKEEKEKKKNAIKYDRMGPMDFWQIVNIGAG
jgi:hypothetical protein